MSSLPALLAHEPRPSGVRAFSGIGNSPFRPIGWIREAIDQLLVLARDLSYRKDPVPLRAALDVTSQSDHCSKSLDRNFPAGKFGGTVNGSVQNRQGVSAETSSWNYPNRGHANRDHRKLSCRKVQEVLP